MKILVVEDDATTLRLLEKNMTKWGYEVVTAENGRQAIEYVEQSPVDLVVSDWVMPEINGLELSQKIRSQDLRRYVYIILISAQDTRMDVVRGLEGGVDDYVPKPINFEELKARVEIGVRIIKLERELNQKYRTIKRNYYQTIHMFTQLLETYDKALGGHSRRVGVLALRLAKRHADILPDDYPVVEAAGLLHDIGLIGLPGALVTQSIPEMPGDDKKLYWSHPERGEKVLSQVDLLRPVAALVGLHHEQPNGRGFPGGLTMDKLPLSAVAVSAASIYDELRHHRGIPLNQIPEQLQQMRGYQLPHDFVDLLIEINMEEMEEEAKLTELEVDIEDLEAGMVLATDVHMRSGAFVMSAGTQVDASVIARLKQYFELGNIGGSVFIKK